MTSTPDVLLELFVDVAHAVRRAIDTIDAMELRRRTDRGGQYALDLVADAEACRVLQRAGVRIVSEESGVHERDGATITVVVDPVDGSTNCSRGQATGVCVTAVRGSGAFRDGVRLCPSSTTRVEDAIVYLTGTPPAVPPWKQFRALGSAALGLCEIAAGSLDGLLDAGGFHAPWDYLAGYLACVEAGAVVRDARGRALVTDDCNARRQLIAAGTPELVEALTAGVA